MFVADQLNPRLEILLKHFYTTLVTISMGEGLKYPLTGEAKETTCLRPFILRSNNGGVVEDYYFPVLILPPLLVRILISITPPVPR